MRLWTLMVVTAAVGLVPPSVADTRARVAILPVVVHSLDGDAYLRAGLADMMASRLGQSPGIAVVRGEDQTQATTDVVQARAFARSLTADYVVFGSFTRFGEGASLDLSCVAVEDATEAARRIFIQSGSLGEIIPKLDEVMEKVARFVVGGDQPAAGVAAPPPGDSGGEADADLRDALAELEALRQRVDALEQRIYEGEGSAKAETDPGRGATSDQDAGGSEPVPSDSEPGSVR